MKWQLKHQSQEVTNFPITRATLTGIRRAGKDRGRGQVDGLTWQDVERFCLLAEMKNTLTALRDAAMIRLLYDCLLRVSEIVAVSVGDLKEKTLTLRSQVINMLPIFPLAKCPRLLVWRAEAWLTGAWYLSIGGVWRMCVLALWHSTLDTGSKPAHRQFWHTARIVGEKKG